MICLDKNTIYIVANIISVSLKEWFMKKFLLIFLSIVFAFGVMAGCANGDFDDSSKVINIYLPDGAPALALVSLFDKTEINGQKVKFTVVPSANISGYLTKGEADLAIVPTNMASIIYNQGYEYKYVSANTHGNLFVVGFDDADSLADLKGKRVCVIGQGQVPDLIFRSLLEREGIEYEIAEKAIEDKVSLQYIQDGGVLMTLIYQHNVDFGVFAEPAVTTALNKIEGAKAVLDIQTLWGGGYPQAGLMVSNKISDDFIKALFSELEKSASFAEDDPAEALKRISDHMIESGETTIKALTKDTVLRSNVRLSKAADCKESVMFFLNAFYNLNPASIGGNLPDDGFFRIV